MNMDLIRSLLGWDDMRDDDVDYEEMENKNMMNIEKELRQHYEAGYKKPYVYINQMEATVEAAKIAKVLATGELNLAELVVEMGEGGRYVGAIQNEAIRTRLDDLFRRSFTGCLVLSVDELKFLNAAERGEFNTRYLH